MAVVIIEQLELATADGTMPTWIHRPEIAGPHPLVMYLMDAPSIRPALHDMASRLATAGYYVMLPYLFYRGGPYREFGTSDEDMHARRDLMGTVSPTGILADAAAMLAHAEADDAADPTRFGAVGFCMSGGLTLALAKAHPDRMVAAASIHGAWLVRDTVDSPHLGLEAATAEVYLGWCDNDPTAPRRLTAGRWSLRALEAAGLTYTLDFYTDAVHGYAPAGGAPPPGRVGAALGASARHVPAPLAASGLTSGFGHAP
jgi:carboxymethylenebutenolidase